MDKWLEDWKWEFCKNGYGGRVASDGGLYRNIKTNVWLHKICFEKLLVNRHTNTKR